MVGGEASSESGTQILCKWTKWFALIQLSCIFRGDCSFHRLCRSGLEDEQHPPEVRSTGAAALIVAVVLWRVSWGLQMPSGTPSDGRACPWCLIVGAVHHPLHLHVGLENWNSGQGHLLACLVSALFYVSSIPCQVAWSSALAGSPCQGFRSWKHSHEQEAFWISSMMCFQKLFNSGVCFSLKIWAAALCHLEQQLHDYFFNYICLNVCFVWDPVSYYLLPLWRRAKRRCQILRALYIKLSVKDRHRCVKQRWCL